MAYTGRTWVDDETADAAKMNTLRDDIALIKTDIADDGKLLPLLASFVYSSGQSSSGTGDTQLTSYDVTVPADLLNQAGDMLLIDGTFASNATAGTRTGRLAVDSTKVAFLSTTAVSSIHQFRLTLRRRTSSTGSLTGATVTVASGGGVATQVYMANVALSSIDWTSSQTLEIWAQASGGTLFLTDYSVMLAKVETGVTV